MILYVKILLLRLCLVKKNMSKATNRSNKISKKKKQ